MSILFTKYFQYYLKINTFYNVYFYSKKRSVDFFDVTDIWRNL